MCVRGQNLCEYTMRDYELFVFGGMYCNLVPRSFGMFFYNNEIKSGFERKRGEKTVGKLIFVTKFGAK